MSAQPTTATPSLASRLSAPFGQARMRYVGSDLQQFLHWWGGELAGLLPASWRALFTQGRARVLYVPEGDTLELRVEEDGRDVLLTGLPLDADADMQARVDSRLGQSRIERPRWLLLPAGQVLRRRITLPAAATERLREVVAHELDRQTPFRADQVAYDCRVLAIDAATKTAQVELLVLPKDRLDAAIAPLGSLATRLSGVDARDQDGALLRCNLLPPERRQASDHRRLWLNLGVAAIALVAFGFALGQVLDNRSNAVARLESAVDQRHEQARLVVALGKQLEDASLGADFLAGRRAAQPPMIAVLADISKRIPDNTFLERFSEQDGQIYLTGLSTDAAGLVAKLQGSPLLHAPALSGSVQPDAAAKRDRFTLTAELNAPPQAGASKQQGGEHASPP
ncbi:MAG TPA: PilN domain-containing protein [Xanthomonadaceae bacterium]|jgi:general secretion pathway protein L|nr:PilN domain-containing protein [Xanthomonadaceae bacterium]